MATSPQFPLPPPRASNITQCRRSVLVVERDRSLITCYAALLKHSGYAVRTAPDPIDALRLYREFVPFNVVVINYWLLSETQTFADCRQLETNGLRLAKSIREIDSSQSIVFAAFEPATEEEFRCAESLDIPMLSDMRHLRRLIDQIEVDRAIAGLSIADRLRLMRFACFRIRGLGRAARGQTGEDLFQQAVRSTLVGTENNGHGRHWNREVSFVRHLAGAMRSISDSWRRAFDDSEAYFESEILDFDRKEGSAWTLDVAPAFQPTPEEEVIARETEAQIFRMFATDGEATWVIQGHLDRLKPHEIMQGYGLTRNRYAAAMKRIRTKLGSVNWSSR